MRKIMVANPKGGCGKSTVATHLASWFAQRGDRVCLGDLDRQQSSLQWLARRPSSLPKIVKWDAREDALDNPPEDCGVAILDTPAGLHGKRLKQLLSEADRVVVPVTPSFFDLLASRDFFDELAEIKSVRKERVGVGIVGMRVDARTRATREMLGFLEQFEMPLLTCIRSTQRYVQSAEAGLTLFDIDHSNNSADCAQWRPLQDWLISSTSLARSLTQSRT